MARGRQARSTTGSTNPTGITRHGVPVSGAVHTSRPKARSGARASKRPRMTKHHHKAGECVHQHANRTVPVLEGSAAMHDAHWRSATQTAASLHGGCMCVVLEEPYKLLGQLVEGQRAFNGRLEELRAGQQRFSEGQDRMDAHLKRFLEGQDRMDGLLAVVRAGQHKLKGQLDRLIRQLISGEEPPSGAEDPQYPLPVTASGEQAHLLVDGDVVSSATEDYQQGL